MIWCPVGAFSDESLFASCPFGDFLEAKPLIDRFIRSVFVDQIRNDVSNTEINALVHNLDQHRLEALLIRCVDVVYCRS